jgi:subtilisin family serine protease
MTRMARASLVVGVLVSVILVGGGAFSASGQDLKEVVIFLDSTPLAVQLQVVAQSGSSVVHTLSLINAVAIQLPEVGTAQALAFLQGNPNVEGVYDDSVGMVDGGIWPICIAPAAVPPVPESYPWGLQKIDVPAVHQQWPGLQGTGVTVAILDTGIDWSHPELSPRIVGGYNALAGGVSYADDNGHGTHMAGIIAAALNSLGIIGVAPQVLLSAVKVLDQYGAGYLSDFIAGLQWVSSNGIRLVNMSVGFSTDSLPLQKAIQSLYNSGVIMVASAGNRCAQSPSQDEGGGDSCQGGPALTCDPSQTAVKYPAAYSWVLAVTATDMADQVTAYSLTGAQVDVCAPGGSKATGIRILSTTIGDGYGWGSGTSQAAAHVTGAVALALQQKPQLAFNEVRSVLQTTAVDLGYPSTQQGAGRINVKNMVQALP